MSSNIHIHPDCRGPAPHRAVFARSTCLLAGTILLTLALVACGGYSSSSSPTDGSTNGTGGDSNGTGGESNGTGGEMDTPTPVTAEQFTDDFSIGSLANWSLRHTVEGTSAQYTLLDINQTTPGALTIVPTRTPGWFAAADAPLIFKYVQGNFSIETSVNASSANNPGMPPSADFNSAGLMARNPSGATGLENHVMVNIGRQDNTIQDGIGTESKSTIDSTSRLNLLAGSSRGRLVLCRIDNRFTAFRQLDNETIWRRLDAVDRPNMPALIQVGMVVNGFTGPDLVAIFDYVTMTIPATEEDCTN